MMQRQNEENELSAAAGRTSSAMIRLEGGVLAGALQETSHFTELMETTMQLMTRSLMVRVEQCKASMKRSNFMCCASQSD